MADNDISHSNSVGDYEDWIELYNAGSNAVDLSGFTLTDDVDDPFQWSFPAGTVLGPGEFLLIWADGNDVSETNALQSNFKLDRDGEQIALFDTNATLLDWVVFGAQEEDFSEGLYPDGTDHLVSMSIPTPGTTNQLFQFKSIAQFTNNMFRIEWNTRPGWFYDLYYRDTYSNGHPWTVAWSNIQAVDRTTRRDVPGDTLTGRRYFRVRQTKP